MVRPKKRFGQHFLTDRNIASRIIKFIQATDYSTLIEVGPGKGILTGFLLERKDIRLFLVEIDREAVSYLVNRWPEIKKDIKETDFLSINLRDEYGEKFGIVGNFPYNISSQILIKILDSKDHCREVVCMLQREVAERICSCPGSKNYGILSVLLQAWYDVEYLLKVNPGSFYPPPEVTSSVLRLKRNARTGIPVNEQQFNTLVRTAFNKRRKMLRNSLKAYIPADRSNLPFLDKRPEQLSVEEFLELATKIFKQGIIK